MPGLFLYLIFFILGTVTGSFLNCLVCRLHNKEDFLVKRSYCPRCRHSLSWRDLIPVFSFLFQKGKCRYCRKPISLQYPLVEIATGILFVLALLLHSYFLLVAFSFLIIIFIYDLKYYLIL